MTQPDPEPTPDQPRAKRRRKNARKFKLEGRPTRRLGLIRDLALGELTQEQLAVKYEVNRYSITAFKKRHLQDIEDCIAKADSEFRGIMVADKANRLATYQMMLDRLLEKVKGMDSGERRDAIRILRNVAEEMGHLPSRMQISGAVDVHTSYTVTNGEGQPIDISKLT